MGRPVILSACVCGFLLVGLAARPTFWTGGGSHSTAGSVPGTVVAEAPHREAPAAATPQEWADHYQRWSEVELRGEAELLWHRAMGIQAELHDNPTAEDREVLITQLGTVVEQSNAIQQLLQQ